MEHFDLVVRGGTLVSPQGLEIGDVAIRAGKIAAVGDLAGSTWTSEINASGLHVFPGAIDTQVHFREPGMEHKEDLATGTLAAICGGVTTVFEMPNTNPATTTAYALADKLDRAMGRCHCDYGFFVGASGSNIRDLPFLEMLPGTPGVKMFAGSSTGDLLVESLEDQLGVMQHGKRPMAIHSELESRLRERKSLFGESPHVRVHPEIRDAEAARLSTQRLIALCEESKRPIHILHISTMEELPLLADAKKRGLPVTCEVTPHHLTLNDTAYETLGTLVQMNPPVRSEAHRLALWKAVKEGLFDVFGSDHAPHTLEEKSKPYPHSPSGMPGVQTLFPVMLDWALKGEIELTQLCHMLMERPADLYGIKGKGRIGPGYDADLVIVDTRAKSVVRNSDMKSKCGWTPYDGKELQGRIEHVYLRGQAQVMDGECLAKAVGEPATYIWK